MLGSAVDVAARWRQRRKRLNHDEIKNRVVLTARRLIAVIEGDVVDPEYVRKFATEQLPRIEGALAATEEIVAGCVEATSPARLLEAEPLSSCDAETLTWLRSVVIQSWMRRQDVARRVAKAERRLQESRESLRRLAAVLDSGAAEFNSGLAGAATDFCHRLTFLSEAISALPTGPLPC